MQNPMNYEEFIKGLIYSPLQAQSTQVRSMWNSKFIAICLLTMILISSSLSGCFGSDEVSQSQNQVIGELIIFNEDGAYTWFQDERAIISDGKIIIGSVASGNIDSNRTGDIDVVTYDLSTGITQLSELHHNLEYDDHDSPALLVRQDGRYLAVYSTHSGKHPLSNTIHYSISTNPYDSTSWEPELTFIPSNHSRVSYSNLHYLQDENGNNGRIYNFFRGLNNSWNPSIMTSDDMGGNWDALGLLIQHSGYRPYVKYASDGTDTIHFIFTEGHPKIYNNSIYHAYYRGGMLYSSNGSEIRLLEDGPIQISEGTTVFPGGPNAVAWCNDIAIDSNGHPYLAYSVQMNQDPMDHRYRYSRWNGNQWLDYEISFAGERLYSGEDDYTGNIALDPNNPSAVYISTNVNPTTGAPLSSGHYEIFQGRTNDDGVNWIWLPITENSTEDNIRPIVPDWDDQNTAVIWLQGTYDGYTDFNLKVVGVIISE